MLETPYSVNTYSTDCPSGDQRGSLPQALGACTDLSIAQLIVGIIPLVIVIRSRPDGAVERASGVTTSAAESVEGMQSVDCK